MSCSSNDSIKKVYAYEKRAIVVEWDQASPREPRIMLCRNAIGRHLVELHDMRISRFHFLFGAAFVLVFAVVHWLLVFESSPIYSYLLQHVEPGNFWR